jgi:hypothetical protein
MEVHALHPSLHNGATKPIKWTCGDPSRRISAVITSHITAPLAASVFKNRAQ